jgi:hypothetical protein
MLRHGHLMPGDLDLPDFTVAEFARFERYVGELEERERAIQAALTRGAVDGGGA